MDVKMISKLRTALRALLRRSHPTELEDSFIKHL